MHPIKLGAVCFAEYEGGYVDFIDVASENDLCWIEYKYEDPVSAREQSSRTDKIRKLTKERGIGVSVHTRFSGFNIASLDDRERNESLQEIEESLRFAGEIGARYATVHAGFLPVNEYSKENLEESFNRSVTGILRLLKTADRLGISLCIENGNGFTRDKIKHAVTPSNMRRIRTATDNRIYFTIDFGHGLYFGSDPSYLVGELGAENVKLSHLHDNQGYGDTHEAVGSGILKIERLIGRYVEERWNFPLSFEHKNMEDLLESIRYTKSIIKKMEFAICQSRQLQE